MIAPVAPLPSPPLSPVEREMLTSADRDRIDAWRFRLNGYAPDESDIARLYLIGKEAGARAA